MADTKRRFYNTDASEAGGVNAKGFTKAVFFQTVAAMVAGDEVSAENVALAGAAAEYELEGIAGRATATSTGEKKDPMQSEYAQKLAAAIVPLITDKPQTAKQLIEAATARGSVAPTGKPWAAPWVSRVLNSRDVTVENGPRDVKKMDVVVETTDAKGLKAQKQVSAYVKAAA